MKITKDTKELLKMLGMIGLIGGSATAFQKLYDWTREPTSVYSLDANGDGRKDLLLRNRLGDYTILLQQEDSTYTPLNSLPKKTRDSIEARLK